MVGIKYIYHDIKNINLYVDMSLTIYINSRIYYIYKYGIYIYIYILLSSSSLSSSCRDVSAVW